MKLDELRAVGRILPEAGLRAYEETGATPAQNWGQCGIAAVAAACGARNFEVFEVIGEYYKAGYVDGFDGRAKRAWALGATGRLRTGLRTRNRYRAGFDDGVTLRKALRAGLREAEDLRTTSLDEELAQLRADELAPA